MGLVMKKLLLLVLITFGASQMSAIDVFGACLYGCRAGEMGMDAESGAVSVADLKFKAPEVSSDFCTDACLRVGLETLELPAWLTN